MDQPKVDIDSYIRNARDRGDLQLATELALKAHGAEVLSFLAARLRSNSDAEEVFSMFAEDLWRGLPGFEFRCTARAWLYTLARNAANRYATAPYRKRELNLSQELNASVAGLIQSARTMTQEHRRTEVKDKVRALQQKLAVEDQTLLMLHIDRGLPWRELAVVMHEQGEQLSEELLTTEAARLRKRFERIKRELRELAVAEGLIRG